MMSEMIEHLLNGFGLFICLFSLALFLTMPIIIMFGAASIADGMTDQFGQVISMVTFFILSLLGLVIVLLLGTYVQEALEA